MILCITILVTYSASDLIMKIEIKIKETLRQSYLDLTIENNLLAMTLPSKKNSKNKKI